MIEGSGKMILDLEKYLEHTILKPETSSQDIKQGLELIKKYKIPTFILPPSYLKLAKEIAPKEINLGTVIGFPLGYQNSKVKYFEAETALKDGANHLDFVINNGMVKNKEFWLIAEEIKTVRQIAKGKIFKVIIETSLLDNQEICQIAEILIKNKVDYLKTSTGFVKEGAQLEDIELIKQKFKDEILIKASGGIRTREKAEKLINAGANLIGTSSSIAILT